MSSSGPLYPGTCANDSSYSPSSNPWIGPGNATTDNGSITYNGLLSDSYSDYLKSTNYGFSIPTGVTIDGIVVEFNRWSPTGYQVYDNRIRIVKGGVVGSTDKSGGALWSNMTDGSYFSYGGASDLWGESWSASDINSSDFGCVISTATRGFAAAYLDTSRITVYYTAAAPAAGGVAGHIGIAL